MITAQSTIDARYEAFANTKDYPFSKILQLWMDNNKLKQKGATQHKYLYLIEKLINPELGSIPISQINATIINRFLDKKTWSSFYSDPFCQDSFLINLSLGDKRTFL